MRRLLPLAVPLTLLLIATPAAARKKPACVHLHEASGCTLKAASFGVAQFTNSVIVSIGRRVESTVDINGKRKTDGHAASGGCRMRFSSSSAVIFRGSPSIKGPIRVGKHYGASGRWSQRRGQPGFFDPGTGTFGGVIVSMAATWHISIDVLSAKKLRVTASGTNTAAYNSLAADGKTPVPHTYACSGSRTKTLKRAQ